MSSDPDVWKPGWERVSFDLLFLLHLCEKTGSFLAFFGPRASSAPPPHHASQYPETSFQTFFVRQARQGLNFILVSLLFLQARRRMSTSNPSEYFPFPMSLSTVISINFKQGLPAFGLLSFHDPFLEYEALARSRGFRQMYSPSFFLWLESQANWRGFAALRLPRPSR